ncbi:hypothetical protein PR202_gb05753 [Eleusine coracana subsp. coracana]|uniref:GB1/RHD3-type G domain-containing protein n=1 Tax=Eleusine coracana subsp. coracana TaxID=191504 RepID=A0AAV5E7U3_ELECO|nr:hypothetical protein PR202_gb05753 [Eleusine coracana subsp. coracana]
MCGRGCGTRRLSRRGDAVPSEIACCPAQFIKRDTSFFVSYRAEMADVCFSTQLIDGDGVFNVSGLEDFMKQVRLGECGLSYAVVSIMGPQSSGKSTLLNHLFGTNFREMDAYRGRSQTTKGIWLAKAQNIEPCTLVMDLEGTDGRERGEDDTAFEKQSALFALAVSDIVLINMWCHDIGREQAANKPLLKTVFQVMMRLFSPRKTTLLFVIRDKSRTPLENLEPILREDIQKIWDAVPKPHAHKETPLSEFFNVQVVALSSYEEKEELFKAQVSDLRDRFQQSIAPGGLAGDRRGVVPASGFSFSSQQFWKVIKENKDLDLPAHKVMVATVRCEEIGNEKVASFTADEEWQQIEEAVQHDYVPGFGKKISILLDRCLSDYDMEAIYFDEGVRNSKRQQLESRLLQESFDKALEKEGFAVAARNCTQAFLEKFDKGSEDAAIQQVNWDPSKVKDKLKRDMEAHVVSVRATKLSELCAKYEAQLTKALAEPVEALLDSASDDTWPAIRKLLQRETKAAISGLESAVSTFELDEATEKELLAKLENHGRNVVESKAKEEAGRVLIRMKDRFSTLFSRDADSMPRVWTGKEDIKAITKTARSSEANKRNNNWLPPPWALAAMAILGFNEFMTLLRNPLYLGVIFVAYLVGKAIWVQSDFAREFQRGFLPAILSLSTKFVPTVMNILKKLAEEGQAPAAPQREMELQPKSNRNGSSYSNAISAGSSSVTTSEIGPEHSSPVPQ